jgi:hypothetical protein
MAPRFSAPLDTELARVIERTAVMRFASGTAFFNHHFIKLGFLEAWKTVAAGNEADRLNRIVLRRRRSCDQRASALELGSGLKRALHERFFIRYTLRAAMAGVIRSARGHSPSSRR